MNKKIETLYKEKNKIDDNHFCLLNAIDKNGHCHSDYRGLKENNIGCCQNLCSFYKGMDYAIEGFIDYMLWMGSVENIKSDTDNFKGIIKTIQEIELETNK